MISLNDCNCVSNRAGHLSSFKFIVNETNRFYPLVDGSRLPGVQQKHIAGRKPNGKQCDGCE